jgi:hypothetical protein
LKVAGKDFLTDGTVGWIDGEAIREIEIKVFFFLSAVFLVRFNFKFSIPFSKEDKKLSCFLDRVVKVIDLMFLS